MNMKFLAVLTPPPDINHVSFTQKASREEKFTPVNMTSCVRHTVGKHRYINNVDQFIICTYLISLIVWTIGKSYLYNQGIIWVDEIRG